jgi:hypothetical protein
MKPPRMVYLMCALAWTGLALSVRELAMGRLNTANGVLFTSVSAILCLYFSFFTLRRLRYDKLRTGEVTKLTSDAEINSGGTLELCRIDAQRAVKFQLKLICKEYGADESFSVEVTDERGGMLLNEEFVPAFGKLRFDTYLRKESLPARVILRSCAKVPRRIHIQVRYAEIVA